MTQFTIKNFQNSSAFKGAFYMVLAGAIFAIINTLLQSLTMQMGQNSTTVVFWQYLIALMFSLPWILRKLQDGKTERPIWHVSRVVFAAVGVQLWVLGLSYVPIWQAIALIMTSPFFVTIGARLFLGEHVSMQRWFAVLFGFCGGMVILEPWSDQFSWATLYPVAAAFFWGLSSLTTKYLTRFEKPQTLTFYLLVLLAPINAVLAFDAGYTVSSSNAIWLIAVTGILTTMAQFSLAKAYSIADAAYLQPFDHLKLPMNVGLGWLAFGFLPTGAMWVGTLMIVLASLYLLKNEMQPPPNAKMATA